MTLYTIGYEKKNIQEYIEILTNNNIHIVVDVRERAWSYKRDFCKTKFSLHLKEHHILYIHIKNLGNPKIFRKNISDREKTLKLYEKYLKKTKNGISELEEVFRNSKQNICLTCFEQNHLECHRSIIIKAIGKDMPIQTINL